jgi:hypothetical protein
MRFVEPGSNRRRQYMEANTPPHITRRGIVALAKDELGLPFSKSHLDNLAMVGRGPKPVGEFGGRHIYDRSTVIEWLRGLIKPLE